MKIIKRDPSWVLLAVLGALLGGTTMVGCGGEEEEGEGEREGIAQPRERSDD